MKKNIIIAASTAASVLLLSVSCQKQEVTDVKNGDKDTQSFTATIEQGLTKTALTNEYKVTWEEGDQIDINGAIFSATPNGSDATRASFTKVSGSDPSTPYTAVYPASLVVSTQPTLPATQTYADGKFNAPMCAMGSTETLEFKNICGVLCFALKGTDKVKSIAVTANEQLCGPFEFIDAVSFCFTEENKGYTVTLDCGTSGVQLNTLTATNFYIYLPPQRYAAGMRITVITTDNTYFEKTTKKYVSIQRNNLYTFDWTPAFAPIPDGTVDLGLSVFWSTKNLGAASDGDHGDYYAFGSTELIYDSIDEGGFINYKSGCAFSEDKAPFYSGGSFTKYASSESILEPSDDAATVVLGDGWRTPTKEEFQELFDKCTVSRVSNGYKFTAPNGNSITLPEVNYYLDYSWAQSGGLYLTSTSYPSICSWCVFFDEINTPRASNYLRGHGCPVRPVHNK